MIATGVGGMPEVVTTHEAGILINKRSVIVIVNATNEIMEVYPAREMTRLYAEIFSWDETANSVLDLFREILLHENSRAASCHRNE